MSFHAGQSFTFGETPSATKWNYLWENDYALQDWSAFSSASLPLTVLPAGPVVQVVTNSSTAVSTGTTTQALDDTIPQNTEGVQALTLSITPKSASNIIVVLAESIMSSSIANQNGIATIFQSGSADAFGVGSQRSPATADTIFGLNCNGYFTAGGTSAITIQLRVGGNGAGTTTINGNSGARIFGASPKTKLIAIEYKA